MNTAAPGPYNFTSEVERYVRRLASSVPDLAYLKPDQILFGVSVARNRKQHGIFAACYPLRFDGGDRFYRRGRTTWEWPIVMHKGHEVLYYITFYLPRFLDLAPHAKVNTVVHELFHISGRFDGDLRRLGEGSHRHHGPSLAYYERLIAPIVEAADRAVPREEFPFLMEGFDSLHHKFGSVTGQRARKLRPRRVE